VGRAVVWQDTRTDDLVNDLTEHYGVDLFRDRCGLPPSTYFAGPKIRWLLDHLPGVRERAERGEVLFGTMETWILWNLTGGPAGGLHLTDVTNASRTMLMNIRTLDWDPELVAALAIPRAMLPRIRPSCEVYGRASTLLPGVPVGAALGDQQAALFGQTCFDAGEAKCTYGTGGFLLMNTGPDLPQPRHGLLPTVAYQLSGQPAVFALEGSIAITGSLVQWLRDGLGLIRTASEIETLARTVTDNGNCYIVPAFAGLYAPHWRSEARGVIVGLTSFISKGHIARAVLEATAWQTREVLDAMKADSAAPFARLKVDGGMTSNNLLMQFVADVLDVPVVRPLVSETVSLGAAYSAGLAVGLWPDVDALRRLWHCASRWSPQWDATSREREYANWKRAVERSFDWVRREVPLSTSP
jgi:glycerol kinase